MALIASKGIYTGAARVKDATVRRRVVVLGINI